MTSPLELLTNEKERAHSFLHDLWAPLSCGLFGFGAACFINFGTRRPTFSGIQRHILFTVGGAGLGTVVDKWRNEYLAERDAVLRHYVELHPEDFPTPDRKKWGEILAPWVPIR